MILMINRKSNILKYFQELFSVSKNLAVLCMGMGIGMGLGLEWELKRSSEWDGFLNWDRPRHVIVF